MQTHILCDNDRYINVNSVLVATYSATGHCSLQSFITGSGKYSGTVQNGEEGRGRLAEAVASPGWVETTPGVYINLNAADEISFETDADGNVSVKFRVGTSGVDYKVPFGSVKLIRKALENV